ncbi:MAG: hypothetical protein ACRC42_00805 [Mycoplasma sp.]
MKKVQLDSLKKWLTFGILGAAVIIPIPLLIVSATSSTGDFVLANYQSYMSPDVEKQFGSEYGLSFDSFETAEDSKRLLKNNTADITNTTTTEIPGLIKEDLIQKVDWAKFEIEGVSNAEEALDLFTPSVQEFLNTTDVDGKEINLLDYGIPYFIQDLVFVYRGEEIAEFAVDGGVSWKETLNIISEDPRFKSDGSKPNLICLDDPRTIYSIPRAIETDSSSVSTQTNASVQDVEHTFSYLSNFFNSLGHRSVSFNTDSNAVLNSVAHGQVNGGFMFNGDAVFAGLGGDDEIEIEEGDFHVVKPNDSVIALDMFVFNKKMDGDNLNKAYNIMYDLNLDFDDVDWGEEDGEGEVIEESETPEEDPAEQSTAYNNFDYVNYTPTSASLYDYIIDPANEYFLDSSVGEQVLIDALTIEQFDNFRMESPVSDLVKSNIKFAWIGFKSSLK